MSTNGEIFERDARRCAVCGRRADSTHHKIHGNRGDRRASNLLSVCGDGTRGHHGWIERHFRRAAQLGWSVSKHGVDPALVPVFMAAGILGPGWYLLDDDCGIRLLTTIEEADMGLRSGLLPLNCTCERERSPREPAAAHDQDCATWLTRELRF